MENHGIRDSTGMKNNTVTDGGAEVNKIYGQVEKKGGRHGENSPRYLIGGCIAT